MAWCDAIRNCYPEQIGTWNLTELPARKRVLGNKWVYKVKYKADVSFKRYENASYCSWEHSKGRCRFSRNIRTSGKDGYCSNHTVCRLSSKLACESNGCTQCFPPWYLQEEVYIHPSPPLLPRISNHSSRRVCRLKKSLYGLLQAPRCWFSKLITVFHKFSFNPMLITCCLLIMLEIFLCVFWSMLTIY